MTAVNDSGSIQLQEKLTQKGYDAWMVAPATNQSGIGSAITFKTGKVFDVKKVADKRYCFPGTPADSVDFGLQRLLKDNPPPPPPPPIWLFLALMMARNHRDGAGEFLYRERRRTRYSLWFSCDCRQHWLHLYRR